MDEHGRLTAYRYDGAGRLEKALYSFGMGKASEDFDERLRAGLYPVYEKTGGPGSGDKAGTDFGFELPQVEDLDKESFSKELGEMLHGKSKIYHKWYNVMPNHWGRWHLVPGEGATAFAERIVPAGMEKQMLEAAARRAQKRPYPFSGERWLWVEQYAYDANNNRTRKANGWGAIDYEYDVENRLMKSGQREYGWDENGNMITEKVGKAQAVYEYGADNRVVDVNTEVEGLVGRYHRRWSSTLKSGVRYEYDALGRRVTSAEYEAKEITFGGHHQINREWSKDTVTEYQYDGLGMDVLAEYRNMDYNPDLGNPWLPWFGWMGHRPWFGWHMPKPQYWWWHHHGHSYNSNYRPMGEYTYGNGLVSRTDWDPESTHRWWGTIKDREYYHRDLLGSTALLTDKFGMVRERYRYDAFGNHYAGTFKRFNELGYTGKRYDGTTGLYNYGFRDYDAESGRFTTVDPIRDGSNWYAYCGNDPVNKVDLWGLSESDRGQQADNARLEGAARASARTVDYASSGSKNPHEPNPTPVPSTRNNNDPKTQTPYDSTDYHCDINAWNSLIDGGRDPRTPEKKSWDGNTKSVSEISKLYNKDNTPKTGTGGYGFYDSPNDDDKIPEHMYRYEYSGGDNIDVWNSDGKKDVTHSVRKTTDPLITNSTFSAQPQLQKNIPIQ